MDERTIIKSDVVLEGLFTRSYPGILVEMAFVVLKEIRKFGVVPTMTSTFREGDGGVHGLCRGLDFRSWVLKEEQIDQVLKNVNQLYDYDPTRPRMKVLVYHDTGRGPHLHLQCHANTIKKGKS